MSSILLRSLSFPSDNMIERMVRGIGGKGFYNNVNSSSYCLRTPVDFVENVLHIQHAQES
jgi:hypothetical protein